MSGTVMKIPSSLPQISKKRRLLAIAGGSFVAGALVAAGVFLALEAQEPSVKARALRESDIPTAHDGYKFIDPLLGIKGVNNSARYDDLKKQVAEYVDAQKENGLITASVDFRDINESGGFVINPDEKYTPASLNKVPVMMAYFKIAETDPDILTHHLTYTGIINNNSVQEIKSVVQLVPGATYTVNELIEHMIRYSDNNAADLLTQHLSDTSHLGVYTSVFSDLGTDPAVLSTYSDNVTVQEYFMFLRSLYNSTYLSRTYSERALQLMSETDFSEGMESGIPNNVVVAEKFGEVRMTNPEGELLGKQINNCGLVYYPDHPYLLCIMTKHTGDNIKAIESKIAAISRIVYIGMQQFYP